VQRATARMWVITCIAALAPAVVCSQEPPAATGPKLSEIIGTGSRIARPLEESNGPVTVVEPADVSRIPGKSIGEILQALPLQNGATMNTNVNVAGDGSIRGDGSTRIDLRGLGAERTLVLLNGRRFVSGGLGADASVDLNTIPLAMIERVEIAASGASAIYGADAVAGVVNIITRRDYSGAVGWTSAADGRRWPTLCKKTDSMCRQISTARMARKGRRERAFAMISVARPAAAGVAPASSANRSSTRPSIPVLL
jgi:outer membrane cobalamin receptor